MLDINSTVFNHSFSHLRTAEEKATKWLDVYFGCGQEISPLAKEMECSYAAAKGVIDKIKQNKEFYENYLTLMSRGAEDFFDKSLGKTFFQKYMSEIDVCENNYITAKDDKTKREWKKMKHKLMDKVLDTHNEIHKNTKGGVNASSQNSLDSRIARAADSIRQ